jgi:hypothetical protein
MHGNRRVFAFILTAALAAIFLLVTGSIGYGPPAQLSLDAATWRRGVWTGGVIANQVLIGALLLVASGLMAFRLNRRL